MRKLFVHKGFTAILMLFTALLLICCDDSYEEVPVKISDIDGNYRAKLIVSQGNIGTEKILSFAAKDTVITFKDFPVKEIIKNVVQDPAKADVAIAAMGKVEYRLHFTSKLNPDNNIVELTFVPSDLNIQIPVDGTNKNTVVKLIAQQKGYFIGQDWSLRFGLVADKITVDGTVLNPFEKIKYDFPYCLKN